MTKTSLLFRLKHNRFKETVRVSFSSMRGGPGGSVTVTRVLDSSRLRIPIYEGQTRMQAALDAARALMLACGAQHIECVRGEKSNELTVYHAQ